MEHHDWSIQLAGATIGPNQSPILKAVTIEVPPGEWIFVTGLSGSGKTTLLRSMYADQPVQGSEAKVGGIALPGIRSGQVAALRKRIGFVPQHPHLLLDRTVYENLYWVLKAIGAYSKKKESQERITQVLESLGLGWAAERTPVALSGGERQLVSIACALVHNPDIVLADEPTTYLDPGVAQRVMDTFQQLHTTGKTLCIATHDARWVERYARKQAHCANGTVVCT